MSRKSIFLSLFMGTIIALAAVQWPLMQSVPAQAATQALVHAEPDAPAVVAASNIACLPFPQSTITSYNGDEVDGPYTATPNQNFVTWKDNSDDESGYRLKRQTVGNANWENLVDLPADSTNYMDSGLGETDDYRYEIFALNGGSEIGNNVICRRPKFFDSENDIYRIFYRPYNISDCPNILDLDSGSEPMCSSQDTVERIAEVMETARAALMGLGFSDPFPPEKRPLIVDLSLCDGAGCAKSKGGGGGSYISLRPSSMSTPFDPVTYAGHKTIKTPLHEIFHKTQRGLDDPNDRWVIEGQARSIEDKVCMDPFPQGPPGTCTRYTDLQPASDYVGEVAEYLADPNRPITDISYNAVLFWTYIMQEFGTTTIEPQLGMDWLVAFWSTVSNQDSSDTIQTINKTLEDLGWSERFIDIFPNFAIANYAKEFDNAPAHWKYVDETQPAATPIKYANVPLTVNETLSPGEQYFLPSDEGKEYISRWGARYYRFVPEASVPSVTVEAQTLTGNDVQFALLGVKGEDIVSETTLTSDKFVDTVVNNNLDEVVLIVVGLNQDTNISFGVNATEPELRIVDPLTTRKAQAGDPTAPEKILVKVEAISPPGGTPVTGLDFDDFTLTVGTQIVSADQRISSAYIQGEYWLLVRAPLQAADGNYDLTVAHSSGISDTVTSAVAYGPAVEADNVLVIDRSGSMADFNKLEAAQDAGRLYVDSWDVGDQIGVVSYAGSASVDLTLRDWDATSRNAARDEIDALIADGATAIGQGLMSGLAELDARGRADGTVPWAVILLSDGMETATEPPLIADFVTTYADRINDGVKVPQVHVVALGADADQATLQTLANDTGGTYHFAGEPAGQVQVAAINALDLHNELAEIYRVIGETVVREQQVYAANDVINNANSKTHTIRVDGSASEAIFVVNWSYIEFGIAINVELRRPDNSVVGVPTLSDTRHLVWRVPLPTPGDWKIVVSPIIPGVAAAANTPDAPAAPEASQTNFLVEASLVSDLSLDLFLGLAPADRIVGKPMPIFVSLSDNVPLTGATVVAQITAPNGALYNRTLFDDGAHGDGAANDGFYGNTFYQTYQTGTYLLVADASGTSPLNGAFDRRLRTAFFMQNLPDTDGDGIPDVREQDNGTDPQQPDGTVDPDHDGLPSLEEHQNGTHPRDPDTDNGGESDASEINHGRDPHDPSDDDIRPSRWFVWPGAGRVWVRFTVDDDHVGIKIYRAPTPDGPFVLVDELNNLDEHIWEDNPLPNDQQVCYQLVSVDAGGAESGSTNVSCATPKADPLSPFGWVLINGDAPSTSSVQVTLNLRASDSPADVEHSHGEEIDQTQGAVSSGVTDMMLSNRADFVGASWEPFQPSKPWTLAPENGVGRVFIKVRDGAGNESEVDADAILLEAPILFLPSIERQ